uniref:LicD family protein n=1 Tax=Lachnospira sp. TaxID=2049031 RepID=UPI004025715B
MNIPEGYLNGEIRDGFYVESTMKKAWAAEIEVLNEVDRICRQHDIQYFADWGTLLGTIRHKGFVPWDDDMDITMKREDYTRFCQIVQQEHGDLEIINFHTDPEWKDMLSRVINGRSVNYTEEHLRKYHGFPYVAGLDIFPLDYVAPTEEEDKLQCSMISIVEAFSANIRNNTATPEEIEQTTKDIEQMCGVKFNNLEPLATQLLKLGERLSMMYTEKESHAVALMGDHAGPRPLDVYPKEYYSESIYMPFEYTTIPVPVGYEKILIQKYGENYMTPYLGGTNHEYPFYRKQQREVYRQMGIIV